MKVKISTTSLVDMYLSYRMPRSDTNTNTINPVLNVYVPARGLLIEVMFPSESHFEEFKRQNDYYITSGIIFIGDKVKGTEVEKQAADINKNSDKKAKEKIDKSVQKVKDMAKESKIDMKIDTVKE